MFSQDPLCLLLAIGLTLIQVKEGSVFHGKFNTNTSAEESPNRSTHIANEVFRKANYTVTTRPRSVCGCYGKKNFHRNCLIGGGDYVHQSPWKMTDSFMNQFALEKYEGGQWKSSKREL